jgi:uncharacterized 2Fe-2S/4Fe-4S cluster protein (DUF4445 family)
MSLRVTFLPDGKSADVPDGTSIVDASIAAGVRLIAPCNGKGTCGKCGVQFQEGVSAPVPADTCFYQEAELADGWRLACMHGVEARSVVFVTPAALGKVDFGPSMEGIVVNSAVRKVYVPLGTADGDIVTWPDVTGYARDPLNEPPQLEALKALRELNPTAGTELTVIVRRGKAARIEAGDTRLENYGLALDIGTTTVAASLLDLNTGQEIASHSALNRQSVHGSDVMSRLTSLNENPGLLPVLQRLAADTVSELLEEIVGKTGIKRERIHEVVVVGNSCMHHVFLGLDPMSLAFAPYSALVLSPVEASSSDLGLNLLPDTPVYALPNIASFIGGDALGATLAVGLHRSETIKCLVDIGTNGEIILGSRDRIIACSTPAGPAFEGASISCGMIASEGAIHRAQLGDTVTLETIGGAKPKGLAGSGLIDICAELRRVGLLNKLGKFMSAQSLPSLSRSLADRMIDGGKSFLMARSYGKDLCLTQRDVRELQLAKGVIFAGIEALKVEMGIGDDDIDELYLAGTFGSYLSIASARMIGLVPRLAAERIRAVGNAAMVGAKMCLLSLEARAEAEELARRIEHVELPQRKDFQDIFMEAMIFPAVEGEEERRG